jgi:hypothetical protein
MKYFFSLILCLGIIFSFAQSGNFLLSHYSPNKDRLDNVCFQIAQQKDGVVYFATRSGLLNFDGRNWDVVNGQGAIYTVQVRDDGAMFWGGANGYGILSSDDRGLPKLEVLSKNIKDVFQSLILDQKVYFINDDTVIEINASTGDTTALPASIETGEFAGIFDIGGIAHVTATKGTFKVVEQQLIPSDLSILSNVGIIFSNDFRGNQVVGTSRNELYVLERGRSPRKVLLEDQAYLNENVIVSGSLVNNDLIALGTLRGGMIFINLSNGKTHEIINYSTGLPDNEIFTLMTDQDQSVWAAHEYGFTRITPYLPFRSFSHYPGVSGNLLCAASFQNNVYVGTSLGLFKLEKEDVYQDRLFYETINVKEKSRKAAVRKSETHATASPVEPEPSKKRGFLRLFKKKETNTTVADTKTPSKAEESEAVETVSERRVLRTEKVLVTSTYRYKKVKDINAKITQLVEFKGKLIACGLEGTFEINGLTAKILHSDPTRYIFASTENVLFISSYSDELKTLSLRGGAWKDLNLLQNLNDQITHIFEGEKEVWLCALNKIYRLTIEDDAVAELKITDIDNPNYDEFVGTAISGKYILANSSGFYHYNTAADAFEKIDSLSSDKLANYFSCNKSIWYKHAHGWNLIGQDSEGANLGLLNLFNQIRFINSDERSHNLWVITNDNQLFKYFTDRINVVQKHFPLQLRSVKNGDTKMGGRRILDIDQDNSRLTFEVVQPDYLASNAIEYRYHIIGLDQGWTEWSQANNIIEIPYLPSGEYALEVESKDIFGNQSVMEQISLNVLPPYWKRPWFYALEVLLFSLSVIASFRLSTRYRIISRLLMLLTIIMLIQFVETIIGQTLATTTSPVIDFLIQVVIAMSILPIEGYLRELMLRSLDTSNRFYRFIAPKSLDPGKEQNDTED